MHTNSTHMHVQRRPAHRVSLLLFNRYTHKEIRPKLFVLCRNFNSKCGKSNKIFCIVSQEIWYSYKYVLYSAISGLGYETMQQFYWFCLISSLFWSFVFRENVHFIKTVSILLGSILKKQRFCRKFSIRRQHCNISDIQYRRFHKLSQDGAKSALKSDIQCTLYRNTYLFMHTRTHSLKQAYRFWVFNPR